jgi:MFS family permease
VGAARIAAAGALVVAVGFILAGQNSLVLSVSGLVVVGFGAQVVLAPTLVLIGEMAEHTRPPAYGSAYALYNIAYTAGLAVAPLLAGAGAAALGTPGAMLAIGVVAAAVAVALVLIRRGSAGTEGAGTDQRPVREPER